MIQHNLRLCTPRRGRIRLTPLHRADVRAFFWAYRTEATYLRDLFWIGMGISICLNKCVEPCKYYCIIIYIPPIVVILVCTCTAWPKIGSAQNLIRLAHTSTSRISQGDNGLCFFQIAMVGDQSYLSHC